MMSELPAVRRWLERHFRTCAAALLLLMGAAQLVAVLLDSQTYDESFHLVNGYAFLKTRALLPVSEHPPVSQAISARDIAAAAARYLELVRISPEAVLSRQQQLDIANHLMSTEQHAPAAEAYQRFLKHYGDYEYVADIYLMLGLLYGRYLQQDALALDYLQRAIDSLRDPRKLELAKGDLEAVRERMNEA